MLNENIKTIRKSKGLSQEELAVKLNVVRQTVSKWEQGLSVPDSDMLISLSEALETPVSTLLGENVAKQEADELKAICEKLEVINLQLVRRKIARRAALRWLFIALCAAIIIISAVLISHVQRPTPKEPFRCRHCAQTSIMVLRKQTPPTARSASKSGSTRVRFFPQRTQIKQKGVIADVNAQESEIS